MKVLFSQIKEYVPELSAEPKEVGEILTLTGFMMDSFEKVNYKEKKDYLIGLEVRQNRADCLSVFGVAREVAAYYGLRTSLPNAEDIKRDGKSLEVEVNAKNDVKRILAVQIDNVRNAESPKWLKQYMEIYGLNSVNLLVDLSNYIMILTGYPSHLIDASRVNGKLNWTINKKSMKITTLLGSETELKGGEIVIADSNSIIALAGIIGSQHADIKLNTDSIIVEIAIYNRSLIRSNSRTLSIVTEASHRLEKELDPNGAFKSFNMLVSEIIRLAGGDIKGVIFDYYPNKYRSPEIRINPSLPSVYAGIKIDENRVYEIFKNLDFDVKKDGDELVVVPPTSRQDITMTEDLVEEVIRIHGYNKIPSNIVPLQNVVKNITPKNIILIDNIKNILITRSFDEILSWPLSRVEDNVRFNYLDWKVISTENSVNEEYPDLRQTIIAGLYRQFQEFSKKNIEYIDIFETGKVFGKIDGGYLEYESLGVLSAKKNNQFPKFKNEIEILLRLLGLSDIKYQKSREIPSGVNPYSCFDIIVKGEAIGIISKLKPDEDKTNLYCGEININMVVDLLADVDNNPVVEFTRKLISLDANVELDNSMAIYDYLEEQKKKIGKENLWDLSVKDIYKQKEKVKYTIRATYKELSNQEAKRLHISNFDLT